MPITKTFKKKNRIIKFKIDHIHSYLVFESQYLNNMIDLNLFLEFEMSIDDKLKSPSLI